MNKEKIINLINDLYRMTSLFPKKEPLRYKMREVSSDLLLHLAVWESLNKDNSDYSTKDLKAKGKESIFEIEKNLEAIENYFNVVKWQNWASYFDVLELQNKYRDLREDIKIEIQKIFLEKPVIKEEKNIKTSQKLDPRKEKIILFLKEKDRAQVGDISKVLPSVAKRTLRRDFLDLLERGLIERMGEKNNTYYRIKET